MPRATPLATPIDLRRVRNTAHDELVARLHPDYEGRSAASRPGGRSSVACPSCCARATAKRRWLLLDRPIEIDLRSYGPASHVIIAHFSDAWRDAAGVRPADLPIGWVTPVGEPLARYTLESVTGRSTRVQIRRRFEINEGIVGWGQGAFAAHPHQLDEPLEWRGPLPFQEPAPHAAPGEAGLLGILPGAWGPAQTGVADSVPSPTERHRPLAARDRGPGRPRRPGAPVDGAAGRQPRWGRRRRGGGDACSEARHRRSASDRGDPCASSHTRQSVEERPSTGPSVGLGRPRTDHPGARGSGARSRPTAGRPTSIAGWGSARQRARAVSSSLVDVAMAADASLVIDGQVVPGEPAPGRRPASCVRSA